jgi:hypothetical protein
VGIDEAGLGPVLGPLVMTAVVMEVPDDRIETSLWQQLSGTVSRRPSSRRRTLAIADSKTLYGGLRGADGLYHLERGVLASLGGMSTSPRSLRGLLETLVPAALESAAGYPWYRDLEIPLPRLLTPEELEALTCALVRRMASAGVRLRAVRSEAVFARELNGLIQESDNKADMHFSVAARLLDWVCRTFPNDSLMIHVDRHGGRKRYLGFLHRLWPESWIWIASETASSSSYAVEEEKRRNRIHFTVGCEDQQLPVALASMVSKYLRELLMDRFNSFWSSHLPELAPTAGYYRDGWRFYREIEPLLPDLGLEPGWVLRCR